MDTVKLILETVEQFASLLWQLQSQSRSPLTREAVIDELQKMIAHRFGVPIEAITPTARFIQDLGLS